MVSSTVYSIFLWHQKLLARGRDAADLSRRQALAGDPAPRYVTYPCVSDGNMT
jgi:hypothetical protein